MTDIVDDQCKYIYRQGKNCGNRCVYKITKKDPKKSQCSNHYYRFSDLSLDPSVANPSLDTKPEDIIHIEIDTPAEKKEIIKFEDQIVDTSKIEGELQSVNLKLEELSKARHELARLNFYSMDRKRVERLYEEELQWMKDYIKTAEPNIEYNKWRIARHKEFLNNPIVKRFGEIHDETDRIMTELSSLPLIGRVK